MPIPNPAWIARGGSLARLAPGIRIIGPADGTGDSEAALLRAELDARFGVGFAGDLPIGSIARGRGNDAPCELRIEIEPGGARRASLGPEGYRLTVAPEGIRISAAAPAGLFYGAQTLLQLLPEDPTARPEIAAVEIEDVPRFRWRGMHLDVSRHFFPGDRIREAIRWLALHKMNVLHFHLTDDQGWRIPVPGYSRLAEISAWRLEPDGSRHGGLYEREEIRSIVQYAADRHVTIVPEIEMPGHARAALAAYPELSCTGARQPVPAEWGIFDDVFCAGKDATFDFLFAVLDEVASLFPAPFIHIGGDECPKSRWRECPDCSRRMSKEGIASVEGLQGWFTSRVGSHLASIGKRLIGWDEILEGGVPADAAVMSWRGIEGGIAAARAGHDVIMTPTAHCYFDYYQGPRETEPPAFPADLPLEKVYAFDPVPQDLTPIEAARVLGGQANVWTERIPDWSHLEYMVFPRLCAMAEVLWTSAERRDYREFLGRMKRHERRLRSLGVRYRALGS